MTNCTEICVVSLIGWYLLPIGDILEDISNFAKRLLYTYVYCIVFILGSESVDQSKCQHIEIGCQ